MFVEEYLVDLRRQGFTPGAWRNYLMRCARLVHAEALRRPQAVQSLALTGLGGLLVLFVPAALLALGGSGLALPIFRDSALTLIVGLAALGGLLRLLRTDDGTPLRRLNLANLLTLTRLVSIPIFWGFFAGGELTLALLAFGLGALTDVADGLVARLGRQRTALGRVFDPVVDILFNATLFLALGRAGIVPGWILALVALRYGLLVIGAAAISLLRGPVEIRPTILGKTAGVITTLLLVTLTAGVLPALAAGADSGALLGRTLVQLAPLLTLMLGLVEAITIPQVILIGWVNLRRRPPRADSAELRLVTLPPVDGPRDDGGTSNEPDPRRVPRV